MNNYIERYLTAAILRKLQNIPLVAILGPRQCGKSTLTKALPANMQNTLYLDLERDIPSLGCKIPAGNIERFWKMCTHIHGQLLNRSKTADRRRR